jgi:hypothetical protein
LIEEQQRTYAYSPLLLLVPKTRGASPRITWPC